MHDFNGIVETPLVRTILDTLDALVLTMDRRGVVTSFNRGCEQATGFCAAEIIGRPVWELLIPPDAVDATRAVFSQLVAGHFPNRHTNDWLTKSGARRCVSWSNSALLDDRGQVALIVATGIDLTESEALREALSRSEAQYRELIDTFPDAIALHRAGRIVYVNAVCAAMLGYDKPDDLVGTPILDVVHEGDRAAVMERVTAAAAHRGPPPPPRLERFLARDGGVVFAEVLNRVVTLDGQPTMLVVARGTRARHQPMSGATAAESAAAQRLGPVDLQEVVAAAVEATRHHFEDRAEVIVSVAGLPAVEAEAARLVQVFTSLLTNAAQAIGPGAAAYHRVEVVGTATADRVRVEVRDTGAGISEARRSRVFEPFFTTKPRGLNTGLGLALTQAFVREIGGEITVESEVGAGTCVCLTLPRR